MSRHPRTAALIGAPTDVGASERGASMGPEALRVAGLTRRLEEYGLRVVDRGNLAGPANPGRPPEVGYRHLAEVVAGRAKGRMSDSEVTIFDSVGFALEDFSALRYLHRLHREELGRRATIDLVPELANPKDLFALLAQRPALAAVDAPANAADATPRRATA